MDKKKVFLFSGFFSWLIILNFTTGISVVSVFDAPTLITILAGGFAFYFFKAKTSEVFFEGSFWTSIVLSFLTLFQTAHIWIKGIAPSPGSVAVLTIPFLYASVSLFFWRIQKKSKEVI